MTPAISSSTSSASAWPHGAHASFYGRLDKAYHNNDTEENSKNDSVNKSCKNYAHINGSDSNEIRDTLCNLRLMEIPRPKCVGFQFVATRGRFGFYQSIKRSDAEKLGVDLKMLAPFKRPVLPDEWYAKAVPGSGDERTREAETNRIMEKKLKEDVIPEEDYDQYQYSTPIKNYCPQTILSKEDDSRSQSQKSTNSTGISC